MSRQHREKAEREAVNTPIQGTAADIIKMLLVRVDARLDPHQGQLLLTVHDELGLRVKKEYVETAMNIIRDEAVGILPGVALPVEFEVGASWGETVAIT